MTALSASACQSGAAFWLLSLASITGVAAAAGPEPWVFVGDEANSAVLRANKGVFERYTAAEGSLKDGDFQNAILLLKGSIDLDPQTNSDKVDRVSDAGFDYAPFLRLAQAYRKQGKYTQAERCLEKQAEQSQLGALSAKLRPEFDKLKIEVKALVEKPEAEAFRELVAGHDVSSSTLVTLRKEVKDLDLNDSTSIPKALAKSREFVREVIAEARSATAYATKKPFDHVVEAGEVDRLKGQCRELAPEKQLLASEAQALLKTCDTMTVPIRRYVAQRVCEDAKRVKDVGLPAGASCDDWKTQSLEQLEKTTEPSQWIAFYKKQKESEKERTLAQEKQLKEAREGFDAARSGIPDLGDCQALLATSQTLVELKNSQRQGASSSQDSKSVSDLQAQAAGIRDDLGKLAKDLRRQFEEISENAKNLGESSKEAVELVKLLREVAGAPDELTRLVGHCASAKTVKNANEKAERVGSERAIKMRDEAVARLDPLMNAIRTYDCARGSIEGSADRFEVVLEDLRKGRKPASDARGAASALDYAIVQELELRARQVHRIRDELEPLEDLKVSSSNRDISELKEQAKAVKLTADWLSIEMSAAGDNGNLRNDKTLRQVATGAGCDDVLDSTLWSSVESLVWNAAPDNPELVAARARIGCCALGKLATMELEKLERQVQKVGTYVALVTAFTRFRAGNLDGAIEVLRRDNVAGVGGTEAAWLHASLAYFLSLKARAVVAGASEDSPVVQLLKRESDAEIEAAHEADGKFVPPESLFADAGFRGQFKSAR